MKRIFVFLILISAFFNGSFAQTNEPLPCPTISLTHTENPNPGDYIFYTVNFDGDVNKYNPQYEWTIKGGEIINGQGTSTIQIKMESSLIITAEVKFSPQYCSKSFSESLIVEHNILKLIAEFSASVSQINKAKLENLAAELQDNPYATAYIIEKFDRKTSRNAARLKIRKLKKYLFESMKIEKRKVVILMTNSDKNSTQFFIVPISALPPTCEDCIPAEFE